ncbi:HPF/RaiA family ribosome-associated protein [Candidatus Peregrinibacteria bacterium]|nr:MAG: HPF/RaiA family ribosome-associated protein [Candidatus Peregrinibacteria bacterium]
MRVQKRIKNLTEPEKAQFETYLEKKLENLRPLLDAHHPDEDEVIVHANMQKHDKHTAFEFEYVFELPRARLNASEVKHSITESVDFATEKLEQQLIKHFKKLARE